MIHSRVWADQLDSGEWAPGAYVFEEQADHTIQHTIQMPADVFPTEDMARAFAQELADRYAARLLTPPPSPGNQAQTRQP